MRKKYISKKKIAYPYEKFRNSGTPYIENEYGYMSPKNEKVEFEDECPLYSSGVDTSNSKDKHLYNPYVVFIYKSNAFVISIAKNNAS